MVPTKFGVEKNLAPKKILDPKEILCPKIIWFRKILCPIRFLAMKELRYRKNSCPKNFFVHQNCWAKEIFGLKKYGFKRNFRSKKICLKKIGV